MTRTKIALAGVTAGLTLLAGTAIAGHMDGDVTSYTGCLSLSSGTLTQIREGDEPLSGCGKKQVEAHLSSGDITAVTAENGGGLVGGGANGAVSLSLRRDCDSGQVVKWNGSAWVCSADSDSKVFAGFQSAFIPIPGDVKDHDVVTLTVPAGTYSMTAIGQVTGPLADFPGRLCAASVRQRCDLGLRSRPWLHARQPGPVRPAHLLRIDRADRDVRNGQARGVGGRARDSGDQLGLVRTTPGGDK